jgi:hypothetical protein
MLVGTALVMLVGYFTVLLPFSGPAGCCHADTSSSDGATGGGISSSIGQTTGVTFVLPDLRYWRIMVLTAY